VVFWAPQSDLISTIKHRDEFMCARANNNAETFCLASLNGDEAYEKSKTKIEVKEPLTKQDLISMVFRT
jgi:hypothetical protein